MIHYPLKNRHLETVAICGKVVPKVHSGYAHVYKQDSKNVTASYSNVTCVDCLKGLLILEKEKIDKINERIKLLL